MHAVTPPGPETLLAAIAAGDRGAFTTLARRWTPLALRLAAKILPDPSEAEDAVQAALLNLWRKAASFDGERGAPETWFRRLVVNAALDRRRTLKVAQPLDCVAEQAADGPTPHEAAEAADEARRVAQAVALLNPRQRAAIALFYSDGASSAEVADALDTTPKAVEGLLARARQDLNRIIGSMRLKNAPDV